MEGKEEDAKRGERGEGKGERERPFREREEKESERVINYGQIQNFVAKKVERKRLLRERERKEREKERKREIERETKIYIYIYIETTATNDKRKREKRNCKMEEGQRTEYCSSATPWPSRA